MAKLRNFTLDGDALRVVAYTDQHGKPLFNVEMLREFQDKAMTPEQFLRLRRSLDGDVNKWGGTFHMTSDGEMTNDLIRTFLRGGEQDGVQLCDALEG